MKHTVIERLNLEKLTANWDTIRQIGEPVVLNREEIRWLQALSTSKEYIPPEKFSAIRIAIRDKIIPKKENSSFPDYYLVGRFTETEAYLYDYCPVIFYERVEKKARGEDKK